MKKRVKERGREKKRPMRERKHKNTIAFCMSPIPKPKKPKRKKKKRINYVPRRKRDRFIPQDHRNANCFHMCFHI